MRTTIRCTNNLSRAKGMSEAGKHEDVSAEAHAVARLFLSEMVDREGSGKVVVEMGGRRLMVMVRQVSDA